MPFRSIIRLTVTFAATGALAIGVGMFHTGGDVQAAGNLVRVSMIALALVIASLGLEIGRGVEALDTSADKHQASLQQFEDKIECDADYVRRLWIVWQVVAFLLMLATAFLVWYFNDSVTAFLFGTPDTRFMVSRWRYNDHTILIYFMLWAAIQPTRFGLLLLLAKACPLGAARVASQQAYSRGNWGWPYVPASCISCWIYSVLLTACLLINVILALSYVRITDRGIGYVNILETTEVFHPWTDVFSITERRFRVNKENDSYPAHSYVIQFNDGLEWESEAIGDSPSKFMEWNSVQILQQDPSVAIEFAANRANLPIKHVKTESIRKGR